MAELSRAKLDELMLSAGKGDAAAFRQFYNLTSPAILAFLLKMLPDRHAAEDVLQESMVVAWNRAASFDPTLAAAKTWITTIARRRALDVIRRQTRRGEVLRGDAENIGLVFGQEGSSENDSESSATAARLAHCFEEIGADSATCIQYAYLHGLTFSEIAAQIDRSLGTIKSWVRRGLQKTQSVHGTMNYRTPEICNRLVERYVLGSMPWRARRRFSRVVDEYRDVSQMVYQLEATLLPSAWQLTPVVPSELVWRRIARDIQVSRAAGFVRRSNRWAGVASALGVAFLVSTLGWWQATQKPPETVVETVIETVPLEPAVAVINDGDGNPLWVALVYDDLSRVDIDVRTTPEAQANNDYQLWILDGSGVPASMGLLPQSGETSLALDAAAIEALQSGTTLAVSLEPLGGSPEPVPTGPVMYTAMLMAR